ncbi:hypothetical protein [Luteimonas fraxinea]|uniref:hypothetical protein n=1 Tax=Luteimonas fraxinea TaxID=2901869 RepID=UPI001E3CB4C8|nr:hypothetical protein [Luteimonas fraxinea]MCD9125991.1 hypothetical protein [Luteimonas fraxinea]
MRIYMFAAAIALSPGLALACSTGETEVFSCITVNGKTAYVCQAPESIRYILGRPGSATEMTVSVPNSGFVWHSDGGSAMHTIDLNFDTRGTHYVVSATRYRDELPPLDAQIQVERGGEQVASLVCRDDSVRLAERAITAAKTPY